MLQKRVTKVGQKTAMTKGGLLVKSGTTEPTTQGVEIAESEDCT